MKEIEKKVLSGWGMLFFWLAAIAATIFGLTQSEGDPAAVLLLGFALTVEVVMLAGLFTVNPNEGKVLQLFGKYIGTVREPGLRWANPFYKKLPVSLRVRNFESAKLKVNDHHGNPIEIAAVVVWHVHDSAQAVFDVDNFEEFVRVQAESAVREMATSYPYDSHHEGEISLRENADQVAHHLQREVQKRVDKAGLTIDDTRLTHLAYAPEIAHAMLQRQQASAIVAARYKIVEGAVGMVENALDLLSKKAVVHLDEERKAAMVSNLLVVLCGERSTQPVVNTGTIYQ